MMRWWVGWYEPVFTLGLSTIALIAMRFELTNGIGLHLLLRSACDLVAWVLGSRDTILAINPIAHNLMGLSLLDFLVRDA